jgi:predicted DNA-binding antitoxin AbrB/MazE fold protein
MLSPNFAATLNPEPKWQKQRAAASHSPMASLPAWSQHAIIRLSMVRFRDPLLYLFRQGMSEALSLEPGASQRSHYVTQVEAVFEKGVFKPLGQVGLTENQRVRLRIEPIDSAEKTAWLAATQELQRQIVEKRGLLPDSTPDIAADRMRDE